MDSRGYARSLGPGVPQRGHETSGVGRARPEQIEVLGRPVQTRRPDAEEHLLVAGGKLLQLLCWRTFTARSVNVTELSAVYRDTA